MERRMMDAASGVEIVNKTPTQAKDLINIIAANSQQFGSTHDTVSRRVNEVIVSSLETKISNITSLVEKLALDNAQQVKACGIFPRQDHTTDMCPTLQEENTEETNTIGGFYGQKKYNPYSNSYNPG
ncbi:hypothetical protein HRI_000266300 [Hibiscus trionum]|uniref:Uncharacterized protein n=1 Tax=Hibiscus trionum TaxID=183268 RepID=A0A9W7GUQ3_HIBTR|nr:hypothetical protein HRI_000266300 [Hibiscus trionum]